MLQRAHELLPPKLPRSRRALRWHVGDTAVASLMGEPCVRKSCDKNGFLFETLSEPKRCISLTFEEFDLLKDGYEFDIDHVGTTPGKVAAVLHSDQDMIANLPDEERELVKNKLVAVNKFLSMKARGAASRYRQNLGPILEKMQTELFPKAPARGGQMGKSPFTLVGPKRFLEWVDAYLEMGPLGLVNQYHLCGRYDPRYGWEERLILMDFVYGYHNLPHGGLGGETPRACWLRLTKTRAPFSPPGPNRIRLAFGEKFTSTLQAQGIEIFGNWYTSPLTDWLFQNVPQREYDVKVDGEDLGAISILVKTETVDGKGKEEWKTVVGPEVMKGVSVAVWEAVLADLRRQNQDLQNLIKPVVHRAIEFAQKGDAETRKRLSILYRPKNLEELQALRMQINVTVRHHKAPLKPQDKPIDVLARRISVGTKAPPPDTARVPQPPEPPEMPEMPEMPVDSGAAAKPAKVKRPKPATPGFTTETPTRKPPRPWKPKERK